MSANRNTAVIKLLPCMVLLLLAWNSPLAAGPGDTPLASDPPDRCAGYGNLQSISLSDWESGLGSWAVGTRSVFDPAAFDTPDWAVVGALPDSRSGQAAFVANLDIGNCGDDDESGVLYLESPPIVIPGGVQIPRISIDHWFDIEQGWDGGNLRISVNGGAFNLVPASAIELNPYTGTLFPPLDELGFELNSNPLAGQEAFTGRFDGQPTGSWRQTRVNLAGIAQAGNTVELRLELGIDGCGGEIGWYVDDVEFYSCAAELPPSNCGNGVINGGEQCDDGNDFIGDGCSNTCQIENGWQCDPPTPPGTIADPSFEDGRPNAFWTEVSNNGLGSPICDAATCNIGGGTGPSDGTFWVWLGGVLAGQEGSVSQSIVIPTTVKTLAFDLEIPACDSASDFFEVLIDGNQVLYVDGADPRCGTIGYAIQSVDISAYADGAAHDLEFHSITVAENGGVSNFFIDVVTLPGSPSACRKIGTSLTLIKDVINDDGGSTPASDWTLSASGPSGFSGAGPIVMSGAGFLPGSYDLSESGGPGGYSASDWVCAGGTQVDADTIMLALDETASCVITNDDIAPTLTVFKTVINDSGGGITDPNAFGLKVDGVPVLHNQANPVTFGDHTVSENPQPGYQPGTWGGDCNADGTVSLALGQAATCSIANDDISPTLTVVKSIINDDGGTITDPDAFGLRIDGVPVPDSMPVAVDAGTRVVSEDGLPGYQAGTWGGDCAADGTITLSLGQDATCTISNDDIKPTLTVVKTIVNDDGGTVTNPNAFGLKVDGGVVAHNSSNSFDAGPHIVSEDGLPGYAAGDWGGDCNADGSIMLEPGQDAVCTISNDDIAPTLTVVKTIINDSGGSITDPDAFGLLIDGAAVLNNTAVVLNPGSHKASESGLPGYAASGWSGDCAPNGDITLSLGDVATCTITNDDIAPTITVLKTIVNDNGGQVTDPNAFGLKVDDIPVLHGESNEYTIGEHTVSETGLAGYAASDWGGDCASDGSITLALGDAATCSITNDDIGATLTVVNTIINDNGGLVNDPNAFGLRVDGGGVLHNDATPISAGPHTVSQDGLGGYLPGNWGGDCNADGTITLALGQDATCTITNDDVSPLVKVVKTIINNNGGTVSDPNAFGLRIDGIPVLHNVSTPIDAGNHTVSEDGLPGYVPGSWTGSCNPDGTLTLTLGQSATCFIVNDDSDTTSLTLVKQVINDDGGSFQGSAWTLTADGPTGFSGVGPNVTNDPDFSAGTYDLSESGGPAGYTASDWVCVGGTQDDGDTITLALGETATCTITNDDITATLTVVKTIVNDNGGTVTDPDAFGLRVDGFPVLNNTPTEVDAGSRMLSEDGLPGYAAGPWGGDCNADGSITLLPGQAAVCTITNDDEPPTLTVLKTIVNDNGGSITDPDAFGLKVDGGPVLNGVANPFDAGPHTVSEDGLPGYTASSWGGDCNADGSIMLQTGQDAVCTITNDDESPSLTVLKTIVNDNGGSVTDPDAFGLKVDGGPVLNGVANPFDAGAHTVSEDGLPGYAASPWGGDCNADGSITLALGQDATCTISNDDESPTLTVLKTIVNDNGGSVSDENAFGLKVDGGPVLNGVANPFDAGAHTVSEDGLPGYLAGTWGGDCNADGSITLAPGQNASCTVTNDDISPTLTVLKTIVNDNGGSVTDENAFGLRVDGDLVLHGVSTPFDAGPHTVSEDGLPGYAAGPWGGDCNADGSITLQPGQDAVCTISNDDESPTLTVLKTIVNDNGGSVTDENAFGLKVDGGPVLNGVANPFDAGAHTVSEDGLPGYLAGTWGGDCNADGSITLVLGQDASCTVTNDDVSPTLTVLKTIVNDDGGSVSDENAFGLRVDGGLVLHGVSTPFDAGAHTVSEDGQAGYVPGLWGGDCNADGSIMLALGQDATCTISNDDESPTLTVLKTIVNDNGGGVTDENAFGLKVDGGPVFNGVANPFDAGPHTVSEDGLPGYAAGPWGGDCNADGTITLAVGQNAVCSITNDDVSPTLTVIKSIINDSGGSVTDENAFGLRVDGALVQNGVSNTLDSGPHTVSEDGLPGYAASPWGGDCNADGTITLTPGQDAFCTITNDDVSPTLTLLKTIVNDNGGSVTDENAFGLRVDGGLVLHGVSNAFDAGAHTASEDGLPGYFPGPWGGDCNTDGTITLEPGQDATCTITNDDSDETSLILVKSVINDSGGTSQASEWTLSAVGPTPFSGPGPNVNSPEGFQPGTYDLSESGGPDNYTASDWVCVGVEQDDADTITLGLGEAAICTISNDDDIVEETIFSDGFESN